MAAGGGGCCCWLWAVAGVWACGCWWVVSGGMGVSWGRQASHPLPPHIVVQLLMDNGFQKVRLFDAEEKTMNALKGSGLQVTLGIPNDMLPPLASDLNAAEKWVSKNVTSYINQGVNISYVAVGSEPLAQTYNGSFQQATFLALQNIQSALLKAGLGARVKLTVPLNADTYESPTGVPSAGDFRPDIRDLMLSIAKFLSNNAGAFTINIHPFISLYKDPNFPVDYAFFDGAAPSSSINDGGTIYTNVFDANHDTLVWALRKNGYGELPIVVGQIGWPTDGDLNANPGYAERFNQGLVLRVLSGRGTPQRPATPIDAYLFSLIDEDEKSIQPGNFERNWGIFNYDGTPKYPLMLANNSSLVRAKNVEYMDKEWCVLKPSAKLDDPQVAPSVSYACARADCTSLGYKTSCGDLDARGNVSYAFNSYYQKNDQEDEACNFSGLATVTNKDPSTAKCKFGIMIDTSSAPSSSPCNSLFAANWMVVGLRMLYSFLPVISVSHGLFLSG